MGIILNEKQLEQAILVSSLGEFKKILNSYDI